MKVGTNCGAINLHDQLAAGIIPKTPFDPEAVRRICRRDVEDRLAEFILGRPRTSGFLLSKKRRKRLISLGRTNKAHHFYPPDPSSLSMTWSIVKLAGF